ncbi:hypothetical protein GOB93_08410 [Acetobacter musti]|uniref:Uncharacterized protein n=1 Tax=Acetobacter musti TaxID=864732 RepID=A0ABX0JRU4_9PROT|nr:hypothetical protein [Acetobacter musti]NHN84665.1 hypothetical protein [Acetobacter musti]
MQESVSSLDLAVGTGARGRLQCAGVAGAGADCADGGAAGGVIAGAVEAGVAGAGAVTEAGPAGSGGMVGRDGAGAAAANTLCGRSLCTICCAGGADPAPSMAIPPRRTTAATAATMMTIRRITASILIEPGYILESRGLALTCVRSLYVTM